MNNIPSMDRYRGPVSSRGFTYVEMLITVAIAALIIAGLSGVVGQALQSQDAVSETNRLTRDARFAMRRMLRTVAGSRRLLLPLRDNPGTDWPENIREQTLPPSPPIGSSTFASAVLAVTLPRDIDLDGNGVADADNDGDGLFDEDLGDDHNRDGYPGLVAIDDDGDGVIDELVGVNPDRDNDEDGAANEDSVNGIDDDGDGNIDEDSKGDMNDDFASGLAAVDDDGDGAVDETNRNDDDEDGSFEEDWLDAVAFHLAGAELRERIPVPWDANGDTLVDGADFIESTIAENVSRFRVERIDSAGPVELIDLTLELTSPVTGETVSLQSQVRVGGAL